MTDIDEVSSQQVEKFPYMAAIIQPSNLADHLAKISISIILMDMVNPGVSNRIEVWSDILQICSDLKAYLNDSEYDDYYVLDDNIPITPFDYRFTDMVAGWEMKLLFNINDLKDQCAIPTI